MRKSPCVAGSVRKDETPLLVHALRRAEERTFNMNPWVLFDSPNQILAPRHHAHHFAKLVS